MKFNILNIIFEDLENSFSRIDEAIKTGKKLVDLPNEIYFDDRKDFQKFFNIQKVDLLSVIASSNPRSIYELAELLNRKQPNVQRDVAVLELYGFIKLEELGDSRGAKSPKLAFDYDFIHIPPAGNIPERIIEISPKARDKYLKEILRRAA